MPRRKAARPEADGDELDPDAMRAWSTDTGIAPYLEPVEALRARTHHEGMTAELEALWLGVANAARGAHVPTLETRQAAAIQTVKRCLPAARASGDDGEVMLLLFEFAQAIGGTDTARVAALYRDGATANEVLRSRREAVGIVAWVMVRGGVLGEAKPTEPGDRRFDERCKAARRKLDQVTAKQRKRTTQR